MTLLFEFLKEYICSSFPPITYSTDFINNVCETKTVFIPKKILYD